MNIPTNIVPIVSVNPLAGTRGVGGSLSPLHSVEEVVGFIPPPPQKGEGSTLADALRDLGLFVLAPQKRRDVATALEGAGIQPQQVRDLAEFVGASEPDEGKARRYLAAVLLDALRAREALRDLAEFHRQGRTKKPVVESYGTHQRGFPCPYWTCECSECVTARLMGRPNRGPRPSYLLDGVKPEETA